MKAILSGEYRKVAEGLSIRVKADLYVISQAKRTEPNRII